MQIPNKRKKTPKSSTNDALADASLLSKVPGTKILYFVMSVKKNFQALKLSIQNLAKKTFFIIFFAF